MTDLAKDLREARARAMMSQAHLAEAAGLSERTIKRAEAGEALSAETLRSISAVLGESLVPRTPSPVPEGFADLVPPPAPVRVDGPTGLFTLEDDPTRLGIIHGVLAGLAFPGSCRGAEGFLDAFGPDASLASEAETTSALQSRIWWIDLAKAKAQTFADRERIDALRIEARYLVLEGERTADAARARYRPWDDGFVSASDTARIGARAGQVFLMLLAAFACPGGPVASLFAAAAVFTATALIASIEITQQFDRSKARELRNRLIEARNYRNSRLALDTHARGLCP